MERRATTTVSTQVATERQLGAHGADVQLTLGVHHLVAVEAITDTDRRCYFLTWGRIQDTVDPRPLEELIVAIAGKFKTPGRVVNARVCADLGEARDAPLFFEYFFDFCQKPIPFGDDYDAWRTSTNQRMRDGYEIAAIGPFE